ncbi:hypothetical protein SEA_SIXAMA_37 [Gordonia phage Sixama]|uniref:Uncharacterized protein n=1 Tax=Gordonia phage Sixama TaxID=2653271 RepID=A0A5Q2F7U6_9CAUD|nr:hypothetical protein PP302_gp037 [Gordonia phage Sixama]QGF20216.1 hypothetical protein SEA_SIXAMA_37 [Gordonia phage Sixama]
MTVYERFRDKLGFDTQEKIHLTSYIIACAAWWFCLLMLIAFGGVDNDWILVIVIPAALYVLIGGIAILMATAVWLWTTIEEWYDNKPER